MAVIEFYQPTLCLLIAQHLLSIYSLQCTPSGTRDGINIYQWNQIERTTCELPLNMPCIIKHSTLKNWANSTKKQIINTFKSQQTLITLEYHSSDCHCFDTSNIHLCNDYVYSFSSYQNGMESLIGNRIDSIWYPYEFNYNLNEKYSKCINKQILSIPMHKAMEKSKLLHANSNNNSNISALSHPVSLKLALKDRANYIQYIEYKHIKPYFKVFKMKNELNDIAMMNNWIGSTGYQSTLHLDRSDNIYFMISGNKTFLLSKPDRFNKFVMFPFLNVKTGNAIYNESEIEYRVHIKQHEIFYLPAFWWHHVINGKYDSFALNVWIENYDVNKIETYQFPMEIKMKLADYKNNLNEILYFLQTLEHKYLYGKSNDALLFGYFSKMYPILTSIQKYHLVNTMNMDNGNWMYWFIDLDNMLKCYLDESHLYLLNILLNSRHDTLICANIDQKEMEEWDETINELLNILRILEKKYGDGAAQVQMAEFIEKILFLVLDDVMFIPIFVSLHFM